MIINYNHKGLLREQRRYRLIIALEEAKYELQNFRKTLEDLGDALRIGDKKAHVAELDAVTNDATFWSDSENSSKVLR